MLPPSIEDFIPSDHLARVIEEVVETINVTEIEVKYSHLGQKSYHPHLLLKLLIIFGRIIICHQNHHGIICIIALAKNPFQVLEI